MTTPTDTRTPADINRSIAELVGHPEWVRLHEPRQDEQEAHHGHDGFGPNGECTWCLGIVERALPDYYRDLNALRDGPEVLLRAEGWTSTVWYYRDDGYHAQWIPPVIALGARGRADTEAAARALAAEAALKKAVQHD